MFIDRLGILLGHVGVLGPNGFAELGFVFVAIKQELLELGQFLLLIFRGRQQ